MKERIFTNPEVRGLFYKFALAAILLTFLNAAVSARLWQAFNKSLIETNIGIIGNMVTSHPELEADIITAFTASAGSEAAGKGAAAAAAFGYDAGLPLSISPLTGSYSARFISITSVMLFISLVLLAAVLISYIKGIYRKIRLVAEEAEKIVEGNFGAKLPETGEGALSKLYLQFNRMSGTLKAGLDKLAGDKTALKNTISDISHQLKTPISSLKLFNELLLDRGGEMEEEQRREFLVKSGQQLERMEWLVVNLLKMARLEAGALEFDMKPYPVADAVEDAVESLLPAADDKGVSINVSGDPKIRLTYDRGWLTEALANIIRNAVQHTGQGGSVSIESVETPVMVRITVTDSGEGIAPEDLPHIFERFYKGRNNLHGSGTGIGLALAKSIVEGHGGIITVKSRPAAGSSFILTFIKGVI